MDICFKSNRLAKILNTEKKIVVEYGKENAKKIMQRLAELSAADNLSQISYLPPPRCHELTGRNVGSFAVDVKHPHRLIFEPYHDPVPTKEDGGIDLEKVTQILIADIIDYH